MLDEYKYQRLLLKLDTYYIKEALAHLAKLDNPESHIEYTLPLLANQEKIAKVFHDTSDTGLKNSFYLHQLECFSKNLLAISARDGGI